MASAFLLTTIVLCFYAILGVDFFAMSGADGDWSVRNDNVRRGVCTTEEVEEGSCSLEASVSSVTLRGLTYGEEYYGSFSRALYTLFQVLTGDSWAETVSRPGVFTARDGFWVATYYVWFVLLTQLVLINVVVAVLLTNTGFDDYEEDEGLTLAEKLTALLESEQVELPDQESVESIGRNCAVIAVSARDKHNLALTADGSIWSWGEGSDGKLGHGDEQIQLLPKKVETFAGQRVVAMSAGDCHSLAITADGSAWSWGHGYYGKLGHGDCQQQFLPKKIEAFAGRRVVAVSAGTLHSIAITADGAVFAWGKGEHGCSGHGEDLSDQLLPKKVEVWVQG